MFTLNFEIRLKKHLLKIKMNGGAIMKNLMVIYYVGVMGVCGVS